MTGPAPGGMVVVDKPAGWTSHDVVGRLRRLAGTRRVGHAGTLDPMATGVLVVGVERATRLLTYLVGADKEYRATVRLGVSTVTDDAEGEVTARADASRVDPARLEAAVAALTGDLLQVPSSVSAVKVGGRRAYDRVRAGEQVELKARPVTVRRFEPGELRSGTAGGLGVLDVDVVVECTSGTYVRALARDLGAALGVGGHLTMLRRTRVGPFGLDDARTLEDLGAVRERDGALPMLALPEAARAALPARELSPEEARRLAHGQALPPVGTGDQPVAAFAPDGTLVAVVTEGPRGARPVLGFIG